MADPIVKTLIENVVRAGAAELGIPPVIVNLAIMFSPTIEDWAAKQDWKALAAKVEAAGAAIARELKKHPLADTGNAKDDAGVERGDDTRATTYSPIADVDRPKG